MGTMTDCLPEEIVRLLEELNLMKPIWVELGLQTMHDRTAERINRCYTLEVFNDAVNRLSAAGLETVVHLIFGLPGESREDMLATVDYVSRLPIQGVKLQPLHILRGTVLADAYQEGQLDVLSENEWLDLVCEILPHLPEEMVVHRLTGDGPKSELIAPDWTRNKRRVLNLLAARLGQN